jgi:colanic acid/amylovoran biosynthesis glycosyltransferase
MKTCIAVADRDVYSETFIRDHIDHLPCETVAMYREWPWSEVNGRSLVPRAVRGVARLFPMIASARDAFLSSFLTKTGISVVLAEYATTAVPLIGPCRRAGVPLVAHFHGYDAYHHDILRQYQAGYRLLFKEAAAVIAGSRAMEEHLLQMGARRETLFYNPGGGVNISQYQPAHMSEDRPLFVAIGRFVDKKAPHLTILAFGKVLREFPQAELVMIGEGPLLEACKQMTNALGLQSSVRFLGKQDRSHAANVLKNARAFVQHSVTTTYGDSEGTAITILEAGAAGLPVVSTRHGGIKESVIHGETGFLVEERDVPKMASYMIELAKSQDKARQMGLNARAHVSQNFSVERVMQNLHAILERAAYGHTKEP